MSAYSLNLIKEMLLIEAPSVFRLYGELTAIAKNFLIPAFTVALILEFFGELNFFGVLKKLVLAFVFMGIFYQLHTKAAHIALDTANITLKKVSPNNLFIKKWYEPKVKTSENKTWGILERLAVPNLNDLLATAFFLMSKAFIWLLKLIYSSVYHLTYVFSGITAVLFMFGWTQDALKGAVQASLWCVILPFVVVAILALVGNSFQDNVLHGAFAVSSIDQLIWLFGITLLLLISPAITFGMVKGDGLHSLGAKMGGLVVAGGAYAWAKAPMLLHYGRRAQRAASTVKNIGGRVLQGGLNLASKGSQPKSTNYTKVSSIGKNQEVQNMGAFKTETARPLTPQSTQRTSENKVFQTKTSEKGNGNNKSTQNSQIQTASPDKNINRENSRHKTATTSRLESNQKSTVNRPSSSVRQQSVTKSINAQSGKQATEPKVHKSPVQMNNRTMGSIKRRGHELR